MSRIKTKFIEDNAVSNAKLAQAPTMTILGNNTGGTANVLYLTAAQVKTLLALLASEVEYSPSDPTYWGGTPPTTVAEALDQIAAQTGMLGPL